MGSSSKRCSNASKTFGEHLVVFDRLALLGGPRGELMTARARIEVNVGFILAERRNLAFKADLTAELRPVENRCGVRVFRDLARFAAKIRRKEAQTAIVETAQQYQTCRWTCLRVGGCQTHRDGIEPFHAAGVVDPSGQLRERLVHG